jgi:hypothetical protein
MSTPIPFDYDRFYNFYTRNLPRERYPPWVKFFRKSKVQTQKKEGTYCIIHAQKLYIQTRRDDGAIADSGVIRRNAASCRRETS